MCQEFFSNWTTCVGSSASLSTKCQAQSIQTTFSPFLLVCFQRFHPPDCPPPPLFIYSLDGATSRRRPSAERRAIESNCPFNRRRQIDATSAPQTADGWTAKPIKPDSGQKYKQSTVNLTQLKRRPPADAIRWRQMTRSSKYEPTPGQSASDDEPMKSKRTAPGPNCWKCSL